MPLISHKLKLIFTHIPKTGGASFKSAMLKEDAKCINLSSYHSRLPYDVYKKYPDYTSTTIIRNSYDILVSYYRFICKRYKNIEVNTSYTFKECLIDSASKSAITNQRSYILDKNNNKINDFIIKYDDLKNDLIKLNNKLNTNIILENNYHYYGDYLISDYYDDETINIAKELCKEDIEYFKFKLKL